MYPKVKVRQEQYQEDHQNIQDNNLKALQSLSFRVSRSPGETEEGHGTLCTTEKNMHGFSFYGPGLGRKQKDVSRPSTAKVPKCHVPHASIPTASVPEDLGDCNLTSYSPGLAGPEKDDILDEEKVNIRASSIPRPRAVISSPDNDTMIGNKNQIKGERLPASKKHTVLQNRHALCKVKSSNITENAPSMRKPEEAAEKSSNMTDSVQKKRPTKSAPNQNTSRRTGRSSSIGL